MKLNPMRHGLPNSPAAHRHAGDSRAHFWRQRVGLCAKRGRWLLGVVQTLALASLRSVWCLGAAETKTAAEPWVSLFNGRDFTGWKIVALTNPAPAVVEDGMMVLRQRSNTVEHTCVASEREYEDCSLEVDLKDKLMGANELEVAGLIAATGKELRPIREVWDRSEIIPLAA